MNFIAKILNIFWFDRRLNLTITGSWLAFYNLKCKITQIKSDKMVTGGMLPKYVYNLDAAPKIDRSNRRISALYSAQWFQKNVTASPRSCSHPFRSSADMCERSRHFVYDNKCVFLFHACFPFTVNCVVYAPRIDTTVFLILAACMRVWVWVCVRVSNFSQLIFITCTFLFCVLLQDCLCFIFKKHWALTF